MGGNLFFVDVEAYGGTPALGGMTEFGAVHYSTNLCVTPHDHNPVNDAMGNVEAFRRMLAGERA